jgi:hypothetical protein
MAVVVVVGRWHVLLLTVIHLMGIQAESETIARVLHHLKRRRALFQQQKKAVSLVSQLVNCRVRRWKKAIRCVYRVLREADAGRVG